MTIKSLKIRNLLFLLAIISFMEMGCNGDGSNDENIEEQIIDNPDETFKVKVGGEIFSIPSPIQTALLIKQNGTTYQKDMLNPTGNVASYSTNFQKALNLGIYGADLGYVTLYDQTQDAMLYLNSVKKLAEELGVMNAFDAELINRFSSNMGNQDSLLVLVSVAYRESDAYLKDNEQTDISSLVIVGGWIETLHFATQTAKTKNSQDIRERIAMQKTSLESLNKILSEYADQNEYAPLISNLKDLHSIFEGVQFKYTYKKPTLDVEKKLSTINSSTEVIISDEQINAITQKVEIIRNQIVEINS